MKQKRLRLILVVLGLVLLGLAAFLLTQGPDRRTLEGRFERVKVGMSQAEVEIIFGGPPQASGSRPNGEHVDAWFCRGDPPYRVGILFDEQGLVRGKEISRAKQPAWELRWMQFASHFRRFRPW